MAGLNATQSAKQRCQNRNIHRRQEMSQTPRLVKKCFFYFHILGSSLKTICPLCPECDFIVFKGVFTVLQMQVICKLDAVALLFYALLLWKGWTRYPKPYFSAASFEFFPWGGPNFPFSVWLSLKIMVMFCWRSFWVFHVSLTAPFSRGSVLQVLSFLAF